MTAVAVVTASFFVAIIVAMRLAVRASSPGDVILILLVGLSVSRCPSRWMLRGWLTYDSEGSLDGSGGLFRGSVDRLLSVSCHQRPRRHEVPVIRFACP